MFTRTQSIIGKFMRGWRVRSRLTWAMEGPLKLKENRYFIFLKEQKYLLKHILRDKQESIPPLFVKMILKCIQDYPEYYLVKHVDLDMYEMPR